MTIRRALLVTIASGLMHGTGILTAQADNSAWMGSVSDDTFVSQLSIPGTHDAGTGHGVNNYLIVSGSKYAVTQEKTLTEQWNSGIRAFDLRPAVDGSRLRICHGLISTNLYFDDALSTLCGLLDSHPTEMCIVIIRHESEGDDNNSNWGTKMKELLNSNPTKSHAVNYTPMARLGDMRGKLLILSRDNYDTNPVGGYITGWGFNPNFANQQGGQIKGAGTQGPLYVQDYYDVSASGAPATKTASLQRMLQFTTSENTNPSLWVINQTSGYSKTASIFGNTVATSDGYRDNAATQNAAAIEYINSHPGPTGIILMDFAGEDASGNYQVKGQALTNAIISSNSKAGSHANYFRALGTVQTGKEYVVSTTVNGSKYYLTTEGKLSASNMDAGIFLLQNGQTGAYNRSYYFTWKVGSTTYTFTNPNQNKGANGSFSADDNIIIRKKDRDSAYDCQVLYRNSSGKYAVRATNAAYSEDGSWAQYAADAYWSVKNSSATPPTAGYKKGVADYIWDLEDPPTTVNVTYSLYYSGRKITDIIVPSERGANAALPDEYINDFCTYTYSPKTITTSPIKVTVRWSGPFKFISSATGTKVWYNLRAGHLQRYVGWEDREPYHPHVSDEATVGEYPETELFATDLVRASDAYQWAFIGNPIEGFKIVNKLMGDDYSLTVSGTAASVLGTQNVRNAVLREGDFRWIAHADGDGFSLSLNGEQNCYVNTYGGPNGYLQIWESPEAKTDLGSQIVAETAPVASVTLNPIGEEYFTTLCLPYDVTVSDAKVYILEKEENGGDDEDGQRLPIFDIELNGELALVPAFQDIDEGYVFLTLVDNTVPAGTPVVLWGESETASLTYGSGFVTCPSTETALCGLFMPSSPVGVLTLQGRDDVPGFYAFTGETIEPNQAYLKLKNPDVEALVLRFSDIEDGVHSIDNGKLTMDNYYDLNGRLIGNGQLKHGIYIFNGGKVLVK